MRIISGKYARRNLYTLSSNKTRPTSDKVKESIFNSLGQFFDGGKVLDLYAGSGALGIEAVSRGMNEAYLIDISSDAVQIIKKNIELTKEPEHFKVFKRADFAALNYLSEQKIKFDLVFLDPPYAKQKISKVMQILIKKDLLTASAQIVAETDSDTILDEIEGYNLFKEHKYGTTMVWYYQRS